MVIFPSKNRLEPNFLCIFDHFARRVAGAYFEESKFIIYFLIPNQVCTGMYGLSIHLNSFEGMETFYRAKFSADILQYPSAAI